MATLAKERVRGRYAASRPPPKERPLWQVLCLLYAGIILLAATVMTLAFAAAAALA